MLKPLSRYQVIEVGPLCWIIDDQLNLESYEFIVYSVGRMRWNISIGQTDHSGRRIVYENRLYSVRSQLEVLCESIVASLEAPDNNLDIENLVEFAHSFGGLVKGQPVMAFKRTRYH